MLRATKNPWVADANAKFATHAVKKINIPCGQLLMLCRIRSELKMNMNGRMAVRISYMKPCNPVGIGGDLAIAAAA